MTDRDRSPEIDPDPVETDPVARGAAEDLDEDQLRVDPLEKGMDPPERWSGADRRGTTPREQREPAPLDERLAEEQPDVLVPRPEDPPIEGQPIDPRTYDERLGTSADVAGGSMAEEIRTPPDDEPE